MKVFKYEVLNIIRSKWLAINFIGFAALAWAAGRITGDAQRAMSVVVNFCVIFVPLIASLFSTLYWYSSERFTHLMLTQPLPRQQLFGARVAALFALLTVSTLVGLHLGSAIAGLWSLASLLVLSCSITALVAIFVTISLLTCVLSKDRMRGVGVGFGIWLYLVLLHDALTLLALMALSDYPLDFAGGVVASANPVGLARVVLLMANDSALLLGHTGALTRELLTSYKGYAWACGLVVLWTLLPGLMASRAFQKKDF